MKMYHVGDFIYESRKRSGLTQEELSEDICSTGTLSKIENGRREPTIAIYQSLMRRLGESTSLFSFYTGSQGIEDYKKYILLRRAMNRKPQQEIIEMIQIELGQLQLEKIPLKVLDITCSLLCHGESETIICEIKDLLHIQDEKIWNSIFSFRRCLSEEELYLYHLLAVGYKRAGDRKTSLEIWDAIINYLKKSRGYFDEEVVLRIIANYNLAVCYWENEGYPMAFQYLQQGIELCISCGKLLPLPDYFARFGDVMLVMGSDESGNQYRNWAKCLWEILGDGKSEACSEMIVTL